MKSPRPLLGENNHSKPQQSFFSLPHVLFKQVAFTSMIRYSRSPSAPLPSRGALDSTGHVSVLSVPKEMSPHSTCVPLAGAPPWQLMLSPSPATKLQVTHAVSHCTQPQIKWANKI